MTRLTTPTYHIVIARSAKRDEANVKFHPDASGEFWGIAPGMMRWAYDFDSSWYKSEVWILFLFPAKGQQYDVGVVLSGIDWFIGLAIHEERHVYQIKEADKLMPPSNGTDAFRYGWSWNQYLHNHWKAGDDGKWGADAVSFPPAVLDVANPNDWKKIGSWHQLTPPILSDDKNLVDLNALNQFSSPEWDWPAVWSAPSPLIYPSSYIESDAINASDSSVSEDDNQGSDWGDPGKQHKTLGKWDD